MSNTLAYFEMFARDYVYHICHVDTLYIYQGLFASYFTYSKFPFLISSDFMRLRQFQLLRLSTAKYVLFFSQQNDRRGGKRKESKGSIFTRACGFVTIRKRFIVCGAVRKGALNR